MNNTKLRVVIFQEGVWLCARCLEYGFATQAKNLRLEALPQPPACSREVLDAVQAIEDLASTTKRWSKDQEAWSEDPNA